MAKASSETFDLKTIRAMLTTAERKVFDSSIGKEIATAGRAQLQAAIGHARTLRDKWRDLYAQQTRSTKRTSKAGTVANDRSREKSELFAGALERLETRLAEVGTAVKAVAKKTVRGVKKSMAKPKASKTANIKAARPASKKLRTAGHRAARANVRSELKQVAGVLRTKKGTPSR